MCLFKIFKYKKLVLVKLLGDPESSPSHQAKLDSFEVLRAWEKWFSQRIFLKNKKHVTFQTGLG